MIKYIGSLAVLLIMSLMYEKYKKRESFDDESKQYELVRKYLLNHSSLAQSKKPILWIHMNYDMNARSWSSFGSRNNDHLNQPYIFLTIKSIIDKCGSDFNICIIDDSTFGKILPGWTIDLHMTADPIRSKLRRIGIGTCALFIRWNDCSTFIYLSSKLEISLSRWYRSKRSRRKRMYVCR